MMKPMMKKHDSRQIFRDLISDLIKTENVACSAGISNTIIIVITIIIISIVIKTHVKLAVVSGLNSMY